MFQQETARHQEAIRLLQQLGLTRYEADVWLALLQLQDGTAAEVSHISSVPRSRIYDVTESLVDRGLVELQRSRPIVYRAAPLDVALEKLDRRFRQELENLKPHLQRLVERAPENGSPHRNFWIIRGVENVSVRMERMIDSCEHTAMAIFSVEHLMLPGIRERLRHKSEAGVSVQLASPSATILEVCQREIPEAELWPLPSYPLDVGAPGRMAIMDGQELLLSTIEPESYAAGLPEETAIWSNAPGFASAAALFVEMTARATQFDTSDHCPHKEG